MEGLTRLVSESLARHGFDRPLDYRRLHWSRWFRCESHHSLLQVPSQPGVFALAEEILDLSSTQTLPEAMKTPGDVELGRGNAVRPSVTAAGSLELKSRPHTKRMLAVSQFFEDDDMAFVLDRMLAVHHPMRTRLTSGRYFVRFVVIEDGSQRRSICNALNQWIANSSEKASSIGSHFATSLELTPQTEYVAQLSPLPSDAAHVATGASPVPPARSATTPSTNVKNAGATANIDNPSPFPSGF